MFSPGREEIVVQERVVLGVRFKIFIMMDMKVTTFWNVTPCNLVAYPEGAGSMFLQNVGNDAPLYSITSQKRSSTFNAFARFV
jgi:hypothetical protein